jgi:acetyl esterase/lipase
LEASVASNELTELAAKLQERVNAIRDVPSIEERRSALDRMSPDAPPDVQVIAVTADGVPCDWLVAPNADVNRRALYFHGGGYVGGSPRSHRRLAADVGRAAACAVLTVGYRLAPEHPFPAALDDARTAWRWMQENGPAGLAPASASFVVGDSAGGGLALALLLALRDAGETLPRAAVTLSAWTDLALTAPSLQTRDGIDPLMSGTSLNDNVPAYLGDIDPRTPLASPLYGELGGLPPLLMQVGDHEVLLDDTLRFADKARAAGVVVTLEVEPEAFHTYQSFAAMVPEARQAIERIGEFIRAH